MPEHDALVQSYYHLGRFSRADEALRMLKKIASLVKPIMRARKWRVKELAEFFPTEANLLGLNVNRGKKICLRLRHAGDRNQFLPMESIIDTMLHELSHIVHGPHNDKFHALWDQLRDECQGLLMKGYTGEGFLSEGQRLGGAYTPSHEAQRRARAAGEMLNPPSFRSGLGQRLGGAVLSRSPRPGTSLRRAAADAAEQRRKALEGCASEKLSEKEIWSLADTATRNGFRTQAEEDAANETAIAQALWEMMKQDEKSKNDGWHDSTAPDNPQIQSRTVTKDYSAGNEVQSSKPSTWECSTCTLQNPVNFLCCEACGTERSEAHPRKLNAQMSKQKKAEPVVVDLTSSPPPSRIIRHDSGNSRQPPASTPTPVRTWTCARCQTEMERQWWICSTCGKMKANSRRRGF